MKELYSPEVPIYTSARSRRIIRNILFFELYAGLPFAVLSAWDESSWPLTALCLLLGSAMTLYHDRTDPGRIYRLPRKTARTK